MREATVRLVAELPVPVLGAARAHSTDPRQRPRGSARIVVRPSVATADGKRARAELRTPRLEASPHDRAALAVRHGHPHVVGVGAPAELTFRAVGVARAGVGDGSVTRNATRAVTHRHAAGGQEAALLAGSADDPAADDGTGRRLNVGIAWPAVGPRASACVGRTRRRVRWLDVRRRAADEDRRSEESSVAGHLPRILRLRRAPGRLGRPMASRAQP